MAAQFEEIKAALNEFADAWQTHDGHALGDFFVDAGTLVNPFGQRADGRASVTAMYAEYIGGMLADTSTTITLTNVRDLDEDRAFVDAEQTIEASDGGAILTVHLAALLQRENGRWKFVDARPYSAAAGA